jgi:hypothetical protein
VRLKEEGAPTDRARGRVVDWGVRQPAPAQNHWRRVAHGRCSCCTSQGRKERGSGGKAATWASLGGGAHRLV